MIILKENYLKVNKGDSLIVEFQFSCDRVEVGIVERGKEAALLIQDSGANPDVFRNENKLWHYTVNTNLDSGKEYILCFTGIDDLGRTEIKKVYLDIDLPYK